jgi:hypothetical protein
MRELRKRRSFTSQHIARASRGPAVQPDEIQDEILALVGDAQCRAVLTDSIAVRWHLRNRYGVTLDDFLAQGDGR